MKKTELINLIENTIRKVLQEVIKYTSEGKELNQYELEKLQKLSEKYKWAQIPEDIVKKLIKIDLAEQYLEEAVEEGDPYTDDFSINIGDKYYDGVTVAEELVTVLSSEAKKIYPEMGKLNWGDIYLLFSYIKAHNPRLYKYSNYYANGRKFAKEYYHDSAIRSQLEKNLKHL